MQQGIIADREQVLGGAHITVPAKVVDALRRAVYAEIGVAAQALDLAVLARDRDAHPERFRGPIESLRESYVLMHALGWTRTAAPSAARVDLHRCSWGLMRSLAVALEFADENVSEKTRRDVEERGLAAERECAGVLSDFIGIVQSRIDALAVCEGDESLRE